MQVNDLVESEKDKKEQIRGQLPLDFFPEKQPTLSNFIVGSNSEAGRDFRAEGRTRPAVYLPLGI